MKEFTLEPAKMIAWCKDPKLCVLWLVIFGILFGTLGVNIYFLYSYYKAEVLMRYVFLGVGLIVVFGIVSLIFITCRKTHRLHLHHYTVGALALLFIGY